MSGSAQTVDVNELLHQVAEAREKLRAERAEIKPKLAELQRLTDETTRTRKRVRKSSARYLKRIRAKAATELNSVKQARNELAVQQEELTRAFAQLSRERSELEREAHDHRTQMRQSWELLTQQQKQFTTERENHEQNQSQIFQLHERREKELTERDEQLKRERANATRELATVRVELTGLEHRVLNARLALQELDQQRATRSVSEPKAAVPELVTLAQPAGSPNGNTVALQNHAQELHLERRSLDRSRKELEKLAEHLTDQRQVLAEQFQQFAVAKAAWQKMETHTVDEIEQLAKDVEYREELLTEQRRSLAQFETTVREREREVWRYQKTLDNWHRALMERETQFLVERESAEAGLSARRGIVADREAGLDFICQRWEDEHLRIRGQLMDEMAKWTVDRKNCAASLQVCDEIKRQTQEQAAKLAAWLLAIEQQQKEQGTKAETRKAARRVQALQKRWEGRFTRTLRQVEDRRSKLNSETRKLELRYQEYQQLLSRVSEREQTLLLGERKRDAKQVLQQRIPEEPPILLRVADAQRQRADQELALLRNSARTLASVLQGKEAEEGLVPLTREAA